MPHRRHIVTRSAPYAGWLGAAAIAVVSACTSTPSSTVPEPSDTAPTVATDVLVPGAPMALTASDGTLLSLRSLAINTVVDEPLAFTELELVFDNPEGRQLDGTLTITMPQGARVTRFARVLGAQKSRQAQDAQVVPRRSTYNNLVAGEAQREPALAAAVAGEQFVARVDAIPAHEPTRVIVGYVEELRGLRQPYRVALAGLPHLQELSLRLTSRTPVQVGGDPVLHKAHTQGQLNRYSDVRPTRDLTLQFEGPRELGLRREDMVVARIAPVSHDHAEPIESLTVLVDTSASQAPAYTVQLERLTAILAALGRRTGPTMPLRILAFDQAATPIYEGPLGDFGPRELALLRQRGALGASNLTGALRFAANHGHRRYHRLLVMTDGVVTAGPSGAEAMRAEARRLRAAGYVRVDAMTEGGHHDAEVLAALVGLGPEHPGLVLHAGLSPDAAVMRMTRMVVHGVEVDVRGGAWVYPRKFPGLQAGDDVLVYAGLDPSAPLDDGLALQLRGGEGQRAVTVALKDSESLLLQDAWASARASWLIDEARAACGGPVVGDLCGAWRRQAIDWSMQHRIVNELTALAVLPSAEDLSRFGLGEATAQPVLTAGRQGLVRQTSKLPGGPGPDKPTPAYAVGPDRRPPVAWLDAPARSLHPASAMPTDAVRRDSALRHAATRGLAAKSNKPKPPRDDRDDRASTRDTDVPDKDAGIHLGPRRTPEDAYDGNFLTVMNLLAAWDAKPQALEVASRWRQAQPSDVMALVALGEALEANGRIDQAARAYGSIVDLFPERADMRRLAAARLERLGDAHNWLVLDSYSRALEDRFDDPAGYRLYAFALLRAGYYEEAFAAIVDALAWARADANTQAQAQVLAADLGLVAAAWQRRWPDRAEYIREALTVHGATLATEPSLRFVLTWDNELADLDLHVRDGLGWHAFYRHKTLDSGGRLSEDVDAGYGLEAFIIDGKASAYPYRLEVGYYARGAAQGVGKLEIIEHDGSGHLHFDQRPFVVQKQRAYVDLGVLAKALGDE